MIKGIIFFEQGGLQQIGELQSLDNIIRTIEEILPALKQKERERILSLLSKEDLEKLLEEKE